MSIYRIQQLPSVLTGLKLKPHASVAFIFCETDTLIDETIRYFLRRQFAHICLFITEPEHYRELDRVTNFKFEFEGWGNIWEVINLAIPRLIGNWLYWGLNGEFLYYPFCESRTINDLSDFMMGERRDVLSGSVIDIYAADIGENGDGISMVSTHFDKVNYFATPSDYDEIDFEEDEFERIKFIYGGLRWRFSQYIPEDQRRIDRVPYFQVDERLNFDENGFTTRPEFYTYKCLHHHNVTGAVMSFHMARYLRHNPITRKNIHNFVWKGSQKFSWNSSQLLRMGFIETGQWF